MQPSRFQKNQIVWARLPSEAWWPCRVIEAIDCLPPDCKLFYLYEVYQYGEASSIRIEEKNIRSFEDTPTQKVSSRLKAAIAEAQRAHKKINIKLNNINNNKSTPTFKEEESASNSLSNHKQKEIDTQSSDQSISRSNKKKDKVFRRLITKETKTNGKHTVISSSYEQPKKIVQNLKSTVTIEEVLEARGENASTVEDEAASKTAQNGKNNNKTMQKSSTEAGTPTLLVSLDTRRRYLNRLYDLIKRNGGKAFEQKETQRSGALQIEKNLCGHCKNERQYVQAMEALLGTIKQGKLKNLEMLLKDQFVKKYVKVSKADIEYEPQSTTVLVEKQPKT